MADDLRTLLKGLGNTADEVADFLRGQGCLGYQNVPYACPIAVYLRGLTGRAIGVCEDGYKIWCSGVERTYRDIPQPVAAFVRAFDAGLYPDLNAVKT